jgi:type I restriction enzyme, S subunit
VRTCTTRLAEICEINPNTSFDFDGDQLCSFVPMEAVDDESAQITKFPLRRFDQVAKGYTVFADNDVIVAKITPCMENGKCAVVRNLRNGIGFGSTEFHVLRATTQVLSEWLFYFWRFPQTRKHAEKNMTGTAGQKRVPSSFLERLDIPIPPLREQERIAALLEKADRLRRTRRYVRELSDSFLQSVFLEMFGDPFQGDEAKARLGGLVKITGGGTPSRDVAAYFTGTIPWLTSKDMRGDYISDTQEHVTEGAVANSATHVVPVGSILVVVKSKVLMHRLPVAISLVPLCHGQDIKSIQCSNRLLPEFARYVLRYHEPHLLNLARGANTEGLTLPMLNELLVPDVSLALQQKFADIVRRFERLRAQQREAERQAEHLFQTLLHRAFNDGGVS